MKMISKALISICMLVFSAVAFAEDVILYDASGNPSVLVDTADNSTVYLSSGDPVGYVYNGSVYSFQGKHLGWYSDGVLWDKNGYMVAFVESKKPETVQVTTTTTSNGFTVTKKAKPTSVVTTREMVTTKPNFVYQVSPTPITTYFTVEEVK